MNQTKLNLENQSNVLTALRQNGPRKKKPDKLLHLPIIEEKSKKMKSSFEIHRNDGSHKWETIYDDSIFISKFLFNHQVSITYEINKSK
jgi:hypothetical protein